MPAPRAGLTERREGSVEKAVFIIASIGSVLSAVWMVFGENTVHSALALVANFFTLAVFYILLEAHFLAAVQIIVYAGAIMVLFLFVIMLLGVDRRDQYRETIPFQFPLAVLFSAGLLGVLIYTIRAAFTKTPFTGLAQANASGNTQGLGRLLFTHYLFPFEVTSLLLIVAAIGAMVIGKRRAPAETQPEDEDA
ncbi:MAG: NADH-quinone oxidoreductase subunit J [Actinobacteria bacterium]|nr:MAG: NADH-quinone oxidoreductase subunit J [Actinomycetota bacterium]